MTVTQSHNHHRDVPAPISPDMIIEQALIMAAEQGYQVLARIDESAIVYTESFDARNGTPIYYFREVNPETIARKAARDEQYAILANETSIFESTNIRCLLFKDHSDDWQKLPAGEWMPELQGDLRIDCSVRDGNLTGLQTRMALANAIVEFAAAETERLRGHDGSLTDAQQMYVDQQRALHAAERAEQDRRNAEYAASRDSQAVAA